MRQYVLTDHEREILREFLETGKTLNGFRLLKLRVYKHLPQLREDFELIARFVEKAGS